MIRAWSLGLLTLAFGPSLTVGKLLWSSTPATYGEGDEYILKTGYLVGNGKLGGSSGCFGEQIRCFVTIY